MSVGVVIICVSFKDSFIVELVIWDMSGVSGEFIY